MSTIVGVLILVALTVTFGMGAMLAVEDGGLPPDLRASWTGVAPDTENVTHYRATVEMIFGTPDENASVEIVTEEGRFPTTVGLGDEIVVPCHGPNSQAALVIEGHVAETKQMPGCGPDGSEEDEDADGSGDEEEDETEYEPGDDCRRIEATTTTDSGVVVGVWICTDGLLP